MEVQDTHALRGKRGHIIVLSLLHGQNEMAHYQYVTWPSLLQGKSSRYKFKIS